MGHCHKGSFETVGGVEDDSDFFAHVFFEHVEYGEGQFWLWHRVRKIIIIRGL